MKFGNYQKYNNSNPLQKLLIKSFQANILDITKNLEVKNILDAGCGEGYVINFLRQHLPIIEMTGLDISKEALGAAYRLNPQVDFYSENIYQTGFLDNSYDLSLCLEVLEHLERPTLALKELRRVTKRYCLFSVPYEPFFSLANLLRLRNFDCFGRDPEHVNFWNRKEFFNFVSDYFTVRLVKTSFPWTIILAKVSRTDSHYK